MATASAAAAAVSRDTVRDRIALPALHQPSRSGG
jgi:hypothetical protein